MKVRDLLAEIDQIAPFKLAEGWDNVGLMVGDLDAEVRRVGVALDPLPETVIAAAGAGCQALLCHHPLFFVPARSLDLARGAGQVVSEAVRCGVAVLAAHTNWDCAAGGVNSELARLLGLTGILPLDPETGLGVKGSLPGALSPEELLLRLKSSWGLSHLDYYAQKNCSILNVALCGGSGSELWPLAREWGADLYVTADMKYHALMDATRAGLAIAVVDHGQMERASLPALARRLGASGRFDVILMESEGLRAPLRL